MTATTDQLATVPATPMRSTRGAPDALPVYRLNLMRAGYLLMGVGLALVKWPLIPNASSLPVFEGVVVALLTAMSLLAFLGLRYPTQLLPILIFESAWKLIWLVAAAVPHVIAGDMSPQMTSILVNVSVDVVILAVTPWDYAWKRFVRAAGEQWRRAR